MKKLLELLLVLVLSVSVIACSSDSDEQENNNKTVEQDNKDTKETTPSETPAATATATETPVAADPTEAASLTEAPADTPAVTAEPTEEPVPTADSTDVQTGGSTDLINETLATTAAPTAAPIADGVSTDVLQGLWVIDSEAVWELSKDVIMESIDTSEMSEADIEQAAGVLKKAFVKTLNDSYSSYNMEFDGNIFRFAALADDSVAGYDYTFGYEYSFDGSNITFPSDDEDSIPAIVYDADSDKILMETGEDSVPFITYMRESEVPTGATDATDVPADNKLTLNMDGSPVTESELEGKWFVATEIFIDLAKPIIEETIGISLTDEEYYVLLEQAGGVEVLLGEMDGLYMAFEGGKCILGTPEEEKEVPFTLTDQGVVITEDGEDALFKYDPENKMLFGETEGIIIPFIKK